MHVFFFLRQALVRDNSVNHVVFVKVIVVLKKAINASVCNTALCCLQWDQSCTAHTGTAYPLQHNRMPGHHYWHVLLSLRDRVLTITPAQMTFTQEPRGGEKGEAIKRDCKKKRQRWKNAHTKEKMKTTVRSRKTSKKQTKHQTAESYCLQTAKQDPIGYNEPLT